VTRNHAYYYGIFLAVFGFSSAKCEKRLRVDPVVFGIINGLFGRREIEKREIKTRKLMHVFRLMLVQIHALVSMFLFFSSLFLFYQAQCDLVTWCGEICLIFPSSLS
jgi:hypothetical protein